MMSAGEPDPIVSDTLSPPRRVGFDAPWHWLAAGWRDLWQNAPLSLTYGFAVALAALLIAYGLAQAELHALFVALAGGFLLIGPLAAVGLYEASRRMAAGEPVRLTHMLAAGFAARGQLLFFGAALMFAYLVWIRLAFLLLALFLGSSTALPPPDMFMRHLLFTPEGLGLLVTGTLVGGLIASVVFILSVVAVPLLLAHDTDIVTAAGSSLAAVRTNPKAMTLWAVLVTGLMALGFASLLLGLVFVFPLIGHATWHACADMFPSARSVGSTSTRNA